jgi:hypothetical protein
MSFTEGSGSSGHGEFGHGADVTIKEMIRSGNNRYVGRFRDGVICNRRWGRELVVFSNN